MLCRNILKRVLTMQWMMSVKWTLIASFIATVLIISTFLGLMSNLEDNVANAKHSKHNVPQYVKNQSAFTQSMEEFMTITTAHRYRPHNLVTRRNLLHAAEAQCYYSDSCTLSCSKGTIEETIDSINRLYEKENNCHLGYISLVLKSTTFSENAITHGWLKNITAEIGNLKLDSVSLEDIGEYSFNGNPFETSSKSLALTFSNTDIGGFKKPMFSGCSLSSLEIYFDAMSSGIYIEEDLLGEASSTPQTIVMKNCLSDADAVMNLTGKGTILTSLLSLDLSFNLFDRLGNGFFSKTPNLKQLYLVSCGISMIEVGAFQGLSFMIQLDLTNNNLKTLPEGLFRDMTSLLSLYISGNPWNCDCDMQWFKEFLDQIPPVDYKKCRVDAGWMDMDKVDFCPINSSTIPAFTESSTKESSIISTSYTTTKDPTTSNTSKFDNNHFVFEKIMCRNLLMYSKPDNNDKIVWFESIFKRRNIEYTFSEVTSTATFEISLFTNIEPMEYLIWTNVNNRSDYGCVFNTSRNVFMYLQYERTYTVCISSNDTTDSYALIAVDCTAVTTPPDWKDRAWLTNGSKAITLLSTILVFLITVIAASVAVYYLVKSNPELIKGNKRVLIVKRGSYSPNVLVMPNRKERHISLSTDDEGYLTPNIKCWFKKTKHLNTKYQELETITDKNSIAEITCEEFSDKNVYEPPPLPPNHPIKRRDSGRPYFHSNM